MTTYRFCPQCRTELTTTMRGDRPRLVCPAFECGFVHWDNPVPVAAAIVERDDGVVLVRSRDAPPTWFGLIAGFVEPGERPVDAAVREVREEIGVEVENPSFIGVHPFAARNQLLFTYHARVPVTEIRLCTVELEDYRIVPIAELVPWNRGTGPALSAWLETKGLRPEPVEFGQHIAG